MPHESGPKRDASAVVIFVLLLFTGAARAQTPTGLTLFGDSLTDTGNTSNLTFGISPGSDYFNGRFSNGPVWAEVMAAQFGVAPPTRSRSGGPNYAHGGAETGSGSERVVIFPIPRVGTQIDTYLGTNPTPGPNELIVVWGGANNFLDTPNADPAGPVADLANHITALADAGAERFLVPNLPRLGQTPRYVGTANEPIYDNLTNDFNSQLATRLTTLETDLGVDIEPLNISLLFDQLLGDPGAFGITNVTDQAITGVPNPDEYLFWDDVHPTRVGHDVLGRVAADQVTGVVNHAWNANAEVGRFNTVVNWDAIGLPAAHWQATLTNDVSSAPRTAEVNQSATVSTVAVAGPAGPMRLAIAAGVTLFAGLGVDVHAGGIVAGLGSVEGTLTNGGGVEPGLAGVGRLTIAGAYEQLSGGQLSIDVDSSGADSLIVTDGGTLDGTLALGLVGGAMPAFGQTFTIVSAEGGLAGTFATINGIDIGAIDGQQAALAVVYDDENVTATVTVAGDANLDFAVGFADFQILQGAYNGLGTWVNADFNGDGTINFADFLLLEGNYGFDASLGGLAAVPRYQVEALALFAAANIPEPTSLALLGAGGLTLTRRRRRGGRPRLAEPVEKTT